MAATEVHCTVQQKVNLLDRYSMNAPFRTSGKHVSYIELARNKPIYMLIWHHADE
jgi:hypothetical protein